MGHTQKLIRAYVFAFTLLGALYGFWMGRRAEVAGIFECLFAFVIFVALANAIVWIIQKKLLPESSGGTP